MWLTCQQAAHKYSLSPRTIAAAGKTESVGMRNTSGQARFYEYSDTDLRRWVPVYRAQRGIPDPKAKEFIKCIGYCGTSFWTTDKKKHRLCPKCKNAANRGGQRTDDDWNYWGETEATG